MPHRDRPDFWLRIAQDSIAQPELLRSHFVVTHFSRSPAGVALTVGAAGESYLVGTQTHLGGLGVNHGESQMSKI